MVYTVETLKELNVPKLREIAKGLNISGRWEMRKEELIKTIIEKAKEGRKNKEVEDEGLCKDHSKYLSKIEIGRLIAFQDSDGYTRTAKVIHYSQTRKALEVVDKFGERQEINFSQVEWVKTGKRWPKRLYEVIKISERFLESARIYGG